MDTHVQQRLDECTQLVNLLQDNGPHGLPGSEGYTDEFRKRCRSQLRDVVSKLWNDHQKYMGDKAHRQRIWTTLNNGLAMLQPARDPLPTGRSTEGSGSPS